MKLKITKELANSVFSAKFELTERNQFDDELLEDYEGSMLLQTSFDIVEIIQEDDGSGVMVDKEVLLLKQSPQFVKFASALPIEKAWSIAQYGDLTEKIAKNYVRQLTEKIEDIMVELKSRTDDFSGITEVIL